MKKRNVNLLLKEIGLVDGKGKPVLLGELAKSLGMTVEGERVPFVKVLTERVGAALTKAFRKGYDEGYEAAQEEYNNEFGKEAAILAAKR